MIKIKWILVFSFCWNLSLNAQVYCSQVFPKVFFGPENVIATQGEPSQFYISELSQYIIRLEDILEIPHDTSVHLVAINPSNEWAFVPKKCSKTVLLSELKMTKSFVKSWKDIHNSKQSNKAPEKAYQEGTSIETEVKEFFDLSSESFQITKSFHHGLKDCLFAEPNDCLSYAMLKQQDIKVLDDYGNELDPSYHNFMNVGFEGEPLKFYSIRSLRSK